MPPRKSAAKAPEPVAAKAPEPVALRHPDGRMVVVTPGDTDDPALAAAYPHLFPTADAEADE